MPIITSEEMARLILSGEVHRDELRRRLRKDADAIALANSIAALLENAQRRIEAGDVPNVGSLSDAIAEAGRVLGHGRR